MSVELKVAVTISANNQRSASSHSCAISRILLPPLRLHLLLFLLRKAVQHFLPVVAAGLALIAQINLHPVVLPLDVGASLHDAPQLLPLLPHIDALRLLVFTPGEYVTEHGTIQGM